MASFHKKRTRKRDAKLGPKAASKAFGSVLKRHGIASEIREHRLLAKWDKVVGPRVAGRSTPDALEKGTLWVRVDSSAWMHQLSFLKDEIIQKANALCGKEVVKDLRFHLGRRKERGTDPLSAASRIQRPAVRERPLPAPARGAALDAIKEEAAGIEDEELREAIIEARRRLSM